MKRYIALFCCMMVMFSFSGCGQKNSSSVPEVSLPPASLSILEEPSDSASNSENAVGLSDPARASAEDLIEPAMEIYSWFALGSMPLSSESRTSINPLTGEEDIFQRVDMPSLLRLRGIKNLLGTFLLRRNYSAFIRRIPYL